MKSFDEDQFKRTLEQIPLETAFVFEDDDVVYAWEKMFYSALDDHCPWREKRIKHTTQPRWMINAVIKKLHSRDHLLKVARKSDNISDGAIY